MRLWAFTWTPAAPWIELCALQSENAVNEAYEYTPAVKFQ
jgi:hypothetical protein